MQKIKTLRLWLLTVSAGLLCACQSLPSAITSAPDTGGQQQAIRSLTERIAALESRQNDLERSIAVLASSAPTGIRENTAQNNYHQAQQAFAAGQYARAVTLLQAYSNGGNGDENAQQGMWLLARSHEKLAHCESAIQVAKVFARRFPKNSNAADAWLVVARCQIKMQQKDIARETLRYLIGTYPRSSAAKSAQSLLK